MKSNDFFVQQVCLCVVQNFAMLCDLQVGGVNAHVGGVTFMLQNDYIGAVK